MSIPLLQSTTVPLLEQVVNFTQARHGLLAGNMANLDTPGYRVRDLSPEKFEQSLKQALDRSRYAMPAASGETGYDRFAEVKQSMQSILYHDQSDVSLEQQVMEIAKNQMRHNMALTIMTNQFQLLKAAISEQEV